MKIYQYKNYEEYVDAQTEANVRKLKNIWVDEKTIKIICDKKSEAHDILCHGTRNATEQKYFLKFFPNANIIGTEISYTAKQFPMTIEWDFHEEKDEWKNKFDIVYSNAIDHSYDPKKALNTWKNQLALNGSLFLEHGYADSENHSQASDPLEISDLELRYLFDELNLNVVETFDTTGIKGRCPSRVYMLKSKEE